MAFAAGLVEQSKNALPDELFRAKEHMRVQVALQDLARANLLRAWARSMRQSMPSTSAPLRRPIEQIPDAVDVVNDRHFFGL